jgi:hypothetical protein
MNKSKREEAAAHILQPSHCTGSIVVLLEALEIQEC